jgi:serine/threonine protein kinase
MQPSNETQSLLNKNNLKYVETVADRRGSVVLRVTRNNERLNLKLFTEDGSKEAAHKAALLLREADLLSRIPHLTRNLYVDHGTSAGKHWLLLREIDGPEVHQEAKQVRESVNNPDERVMRLMRLVQKVSGFYDALYQGGYLHGDVQPAHTFLERDEISVIDWGLARKIEEPNPLYKGGFVYFVAPEIAVQMRSGDTEVGYTARAEVYALGATLFLFYTGHLAIDFGIPKEELKEAPMEQKLQRVMENRIFSFREVGADPHPAFEALLRKSLSTNPNERFDTPSLFHQNLQES